MTFKAFENLEGLIPKIRVYPRKSAAKIFYSSTTLLYAGNETLPSVTPTSPEES